MANDLKKIMTRAQSLKRNNPNLTLGYCLRLSWAAYRLHYEMLGGNIVEFEFIKAKTGEKRKAYGTAPSQYLEPDRRFENVFLYFDAEANQLRSFKIENLVID